MMKAFAGHLSKQGDQGNWLWLKDIKKKSQNSANIRTMCGNSGFLVCYKKAHKKTIMLIMKLLVFVFRDGNRAHFAQIGERLLVL